MAIGETITQSKSMITSSNSFNIPQSYKTNKNSTTDGRTGQLVARQQRIERWVYQGRSSSSNNTITTTAAALGTAAAQKRSESSFTQTGRKLDIQLLYLSEQRQKVIEQRNFDQKLFANKQALRHKDDQNILK